MAKLGTIQFYRGTAAQWTSANPTLGAGEPGFESDTNKLKIGDGSTAWNSLAYFAPGGNDMDISTASTAGGTITLDFDSEDQRIFVGSASFATPKTIALADATNAKKLDLIFTVTNVAAALTFPAAFIMSDVRWNTSTQEWEPVDTGTYKLTAIFDGTNWVMDISQSPYL